MSITNKTVIYRFLKKIGIPYSDAYRLATELDELIKKNNQATTSSNSPRIEE